MVFDHVMLQVTNVLMDWNDGTVLEIHIMFYKTLLKVAVQFPQF